TCLRLASKPSSIVRQHIDSLKINLSFYFCTRALYHIKTTRISTPYLCVAYMCDIFFQPLLCLVRCLLYSRVCKSRPIERIAYWSLDDRGVFRGEPCDSERCGMRMTIPVPGHLGRP